MYIYEAASGRTILAQQCDLSRGENLVNLASPLANGLYLVSFTGEWGSMVAKVVVR